MRVFVYGFFFYILALIATKKRTAKTWRKKKNNGSRLLDLPCVTESEPPAMVNSGFLDHKPAAAAEHQRAGGTSQAHCGAIEFEYLQMNLKFNAVAGIAIRIYRILQDF